MTLSNQELLDDLRVRVKNGNKEYWRSQLMNILQESLPSEENLYYMEFAANPYFFSEENGNIKVGCFQEGYMKAFETIKKMFTEKK